MARSEIQIKLTIIREERMWTQGRLAEEAKVSPTTVSGIESGRISRPHFGTIEKLAGALKVDPRELLSPKVPGNGRVRSPSRSDGLRPHGRRSSRRASRRPRSTACGSSRGSSTRSKSGSANSTGRHETPSSDGS
jgi:transcriptional regulator with XRE-family HTH domain